MAKFDKQSLCQRYFCSSFANVFAKFYEIPSLPFQDIEKLKCRGRTDSVKTAYPPQTQFAGSIMRNLYIFFMLGGGLVNKHS